MTVLRDVLEAIHERRCSPDPGSDLFSVIDSYKKTAAESAAGVMPSNFSYPIGDLRRYGGDSTGTNDNFAAFTSLFSVMLAAGGMSIVLPPGTYNLATSLVLNIIPSSGPSSQTHGFIISGYGATINFTGSGYAFDLTATGTSAFYSHPDVSFSGLNFTGTSSASGAIRTTDVNNGRYKDVYAFNFTKGAAFTLRNLVNWSEVNEYRGCGAITCYTGWSFVYTSGSNSFARTLIDHPFCAGIVADWFDVGGGCSLYDSHIVDISGNMGCLSMMAVGTSTGNSADLTATVVDGINYEVNAAPAITFTAGLSGGATSGTLTSGFVFPSGQYKTVFSDSETRLVTYTNSGTTATWTGGLSGSVTASASLAQSIFRLRDYPQNTGVARRPVVYNVGAYAFGAGGISLWSDGTNTSQNLEPIQTQPLIARTTLQSYEPGFGLNSIVNAATYDEQGGITCNVTGCTASISGRVNFYRTGNMAFAEVFDPLTGTSNTNAMTLTGIPAEFQPVNTGFGNCIVVNNTNATTPALYTISGGTLTFSVATAFNTYSATGFTNSGTKGLSTGLIMSWPLT